MYFKCFDQESETNSERLHNKVSGKIVDLVKEGLTCVKEVQRQLEVFVNMELCPELWKPYHSNRRYYPTLGVIRNKMYHALIRRRLEIIKDVNSIIEFIGEQQGMKLYCLQFLFNIISVVKADYFTL